MENNNIEDDSIDIRQILAILKKYFRLLVVIPAVAVAVAGIAVFYVVAPVYRAETTLIVRNQTATQITQADLLASRQLVRTYREIARSRSVAVEVKASLGLQHSVEQLQAMVDVTLRGDTEVLAISVENTNPAFAALLANAVGDAFQKITLRVMQVENVMVVDRAVAPEVPVHPRKLLSVVVAGMVGGMVAVATAFVLSYLDNTFKRPEDVERLLGLPVLGAIPLFKDEDFEKAQRGGQS